MAFLARVYSLTRNGFAPRTQRTQRAPRVRGLEGGRFFEAVDEAFPVSLEEFAATMDQQAEL